MDPRIEWANAEITTSIAFGKVWLSQEADLQKRSHRCWRRRIVPQDAVFDVIS
jgi:hypothetical protein